MTFDSALQVVEEINSKELYYQLIAQINKDFDRAGCDIMLTKNMLPHTLVNELKVALNNLINHQPSDLNQLLYLIDLSEKDLSWVTFEKETLAVQQLSYLILKREWQKVYFRSLHSSQQ